ncbi:MAG: aldehyde ferredoxin oxidoreductase family protein [Promethearchaeota archaeon]
MKGYAGKFLEIDLSNKNMKEIRFTEDILRDYIGGRGLATKILWDRLGSKWETVDPFGSENILLVLTGPLTGFFPGARICISGKSPQSNGIIGSTISGEFGIDMKCAGYDGLIFINKSEKPCYLQISDENVEIKDASQIWGKKARDTVRYIVKKSIEEIKEEHPKYGQIKEPSILYIGPAGENKTRVAVVCSKYSHAAGYGGYGGVMGSKNLKAIVAKGFGPLPEIAENETTLNLIEKISERNIQNTFFRRWGTGSGCFMFGNMTSSEPIRNWQEEWHNNQKYSGKEFEKYWVKKNWGDYGCPLSCLKLSVLKTGEYKGAICDNPDYELQAYLGTNLGIFNPEENIYLSSNIEELGLCAIQAGAVLGFAAELYEKHVLTENDLNGMKLKWGETRTFASLAEKVAFRRDIGDLLAEGVYRAALEIGKIKKIDLLKYAVHEKGVAIGAHGNRSGKDFISSNISYACSVQAGDHGSPAILPIDGGHGELSTIMADSAVFCGFNATLLRFKEIINFYRAVTGWELSEEEWFKEKARRILQLQRAMLLLGGPDVQWKPKEDDDNPPRFWEPLTSGPYTGKSLDRKKFEEARFEYYDNIGWNENGVPKPETLKNLDLMDVEIKLKEFGLIR